MTALQRSCPHCGFINAADASFCGNCGRSMAGGTVTSPAGSMTLCPHCERENPAGADFCGHCGQALTGRVAPPPEPVPPPENVHKRRSILPILVAAFGLDYAQADDASGLDAALATAFARGGAWLVRAVIDRAASRAGFAD